MTESEKIAYAKLFIDKLATGINPLNDLPIPENDVANNVRLSRCFFYVSEILQKELEREKRKEAKQRTPKPVLEPFSITQEQLQLFAYSKTPISVSAMGKKINWLVREAIEAKRMQRFSYRKINYWLRATGLIEWREWNQQAYKRFPTAEGEAMGIILQPWNQYEYSVPVIYLTEQAQHLIIDNIEAVMAAEKGTPDSLHAEKEEASED